MDVLDAVRAIAVKGDANIQLRCWHPARRDVIAQHIVGVGRRSIRIARRSIEWCVVPCVRGPGPMKVIGHDIKIVHHGLDGGKINVLRRPIAIGHRRGDQPAWRGRRRAIKLGAQVRDQRGVVGPIGSAGRKLPINIHAIVTIGIKKIIDRVDKCRAPGEVAGKGRKIGARSATATAHAQEHLDPCSMRRRDHARLDKTAWDVKRTVAVGCHKGMIKVCELSPRDGTRWIRPLAPFCVVSAHALAQRRMTLPWTGQRPDQHQSLAYED